MSRSKKDAEIILPSDIGPVPESVLEEVAKGSGVEAKLVLPKRGFGWKCDAVDERDYKMGALLGGVVSLPSEALALEKTLPPIDDQGVASGCVGAAGSGACEARLLALGVPTPRLSWMGNYKLTRSFERIDPKQALVDDGSYIRLFFLAGKDRGLLLESESPSSDYSKVNDELMLTDLMRMSAHKIGQFYRIQESGQARVERVCQALVSRYPVVFGLKITKGFMLHMGTDVFGGFGDEARIGGHAVCVVGYRTVNGRRQFLLRNSWGTGWGFGGYAWVDQDFIADSTADNFTAATLTPVAFKEDPAPAKVG